MDGFRGDQAPAQTMRTQLLERAPWASWIRRLFQRANALEGFYTENLVVGPARDLYLCKKSTHMGSARQ